MSKQQDVYACECIWDSSCELKRDNASMIKYSRGRNIHIHCLYLLRETRTRIAPCTIVLYVCIERNSYFPFSPQSSLRCCLYGNNKRWREEVLYSVYYLVGWFFFRVIILSALHRYLLAFFFLILPTRFVDKRPRKGRGHPIAEKKQVISSCKRGCFFFCSSSESNIQHNTLFFHYYCVSLSFSLPVLVCKSSSCYTRTHTHNQKTTHYIGCIVNNTERKYVFIV